MQKKKAQNAFFLFVPYNILLFSFRKKYRKNTGTLLFFIPFAETQFFCKKSFANEGFFLYISRKMNTIKMIDTKNISLYIAERRISEWITIPN